MIEPCDICSDDPECDGGPFCGCVCHDGGLSMACTMCEAATNAGDKHYYYRFESGNVLIIGCEGHVKKVFEVLNNYQRSVTEGIGQTFNKRKEELL